MKPSDALEAGRTLLPHGKDNFFTVEAGQLCACPLGMMLIGVKTWDEVTEWSVEALNLDSADALLDRFPNLGESRPPLCSCPIMTQHERTMSMILGHMNDKHGWNVDQVLAYLKEQGL